MQKAVTAGIGATIVAYLVGAMFGTYGAWSLALNQPATPIGRWILVLTLGVILAAAYNFFGFAKSLPGDALTKGATFGLFVWLVTLVVGAILTTVGQYVYATPVGTTIFLSLLLHLVWGGLLGFFFQENFK